MHLNVCAQSRLSFFIRQTLLREIRGVQALKGTFLKIDWDFGHVNYYMKLIAVQNLSKWLPVNV